MRSFTPDTNPEVLEWARKVIGLRRARAAEELDVLESTLFLWEEGNVKPDIHDLMRMAKVYKKPLATLLRSSLPKNEKPIDVDYRLLPIDQKQEWSSELWLALWRVQLQHDVAIELGELEENVPPPLPVAIELSESSEVAAQRIREWLEAAADRPVNSYGKRDFSQWLTLVENQGILVVQASNVGLKEMRGCSISEQPFPIILLNSNDSPPGRLFTLMHELSHILLRAGGLCDLEDKYQTVRNEHERVERFCNEIAAAILLPRQNMLDDWRIATASPTTRWSDQDIRELARRFGVSREAILLRLISLDRAPWSLYRDLKPRYERAYEENRPASPTSHFFAPNQRKIRDYGRRYTASVLNAYNREDITALDAADFLHTTIGNLPKLEERLGIRR
jgi:Zn-dependent peptidase ImmA (M78 family)/DNA-binding XRE family transcriptional regulator